MDLTIYQDLSQEYYIIRRIEDRFQEKRQLRNLFIWKLYIVIIDKYVIDNNYIYIIIRFIYILFNYYNYYNYYIY